MNRIALIHKLRPGLKVNGSDNKVLGVCRAESVCPYDWGGQWLEVQGLYLLPLCFFLSLISHFAFSSPCPPPLPYTHILTLLIWEGFFFSISRRQMLWDQWQQEPILIQDQDTVNPSQITNTSIKFSFSKVHCEFLSNTSIHRSKISWELNISSRLQNTPFFDITVYKKSHFLASSYEKTSWKGFINFSLHALIPRCRKRFPNQLKCVMGSKHGFLPFEGLIC